MSQALVLKAAEYVRLKLHHEPSGHDWFHVERVWKIAKLLQAKEGGNLLLIELGALLHNLKEHNYPLFLEERGSLALNGMMDILQIDEELKKKISLVVEDSKYKADDTRKPATIEGRILQDANWLDALGAVGVARAFASGGNLGRPIYDPLIKVRKKLNKYSYQQKRRESTSINYLYEKALRVAESLNTKTAQDIATRRVKFIEQFLTEFMREWEGYDITVDPFPSFSARTTE